MTTEGTAPKKTWLNPLEYISVFPEDTREKLMLLRATILDAAPGAREVISYGMPAVKMNGPLVWYAAYKKHIGFYPHGSEAIDFFRSELGGFTCSKGAIQFPLNSPLPLELVRKIVKFRIERDEEKRSSKAGKSKKI